MFLNPLFLLPPSKAHAAGKTLLKAIGSSSRVRHSLEKFLFVKDPVDVCGLTFPNRLGIAAGFDKDGEIFPALSSLGFGHIEVGSVTYPANQGLEKKVLKRDRQRASLTNHLGMPSVGHGQAFSNIRKRKKDLKSAVGVSLGVLPDTAPFECARFVKHFSLLADYITVNISCPNVAQHKEFDLLLKACGSEKSRVPFFIKVSAEWEDQEVFRIVSQALSSGFDGVVCSNTIKGVSGRPIESASNRLLSLLYYHTRGKVPLIGVGGVFDRESYLRKIDAGATLVQMYSGFVFGGPFIAKKILGDQK